MKSIQYTSLLAAALCLSQTALSQADQPVAVFSPAPAGSLVVTTATVGQQSPRIAVMQAPQPGLSPLPGAIALVQNQALPKTPAPPRPDAATETSVELDQARADVDRAQAQLQQWANTMSADAGQDPYRIWSIQPGASSEPRALVIRSSETDAKTLAATEKDLNIMGRILEKSLTSPEDGPHRAMGIRVYTLGDHSRVSNLQIEGYGAIFMLHVNFPLVGPASKSEESADKGPSNSTWDEAEHDLYGPPPGSEAFHGAAMLKEDYDPNRVEKLKNVLLDALKNASHMRHLKSDENVMIVVTSGGGGGQYDEAMAVFTQKFQSAVRAGAAGTTGYGGGGGGGGGGGAGEKPRIHEKNVFRDGGTRSTLTIRARKSDIDAFANGKLNPKEFRNKVEMLVY